MKGLRKDWGPFPYNESKQHFQQTRFKAPFPFFFYIYWYVILYKKRKTWWKWDWYLETFFCLWIVCHYAEAAAYSVVRCAIWYQSLFGVCMVVRTHANVCCRFFLPSCHFYLFAWVTMAFEWVYQLSNACMPFKRVNISNLMTFDFFFFFYKKPKYIAKIKTL